MSALHLISQQELPWNRRDGRDIPPHCVEMERNQRDKRDVPSLRRHGKDSTQGEGDTLPSCLTGHGGCCFRWAEDVGGWEKGVARV